MRENYSSSANLLKYDNVSSSSLALEVTSVFYERLGFIKEYDFDVEPGFQVAWFRDNRFKEDTVDDETSFIGFSWDKSLDVQE